MSAGNHCCGGIRPMMCFKRGATFTASCTWDPSESGVPNLIGATITSQIRYRGKLVQDLDATLAPDGMSFVLKAEETDTASWPAALCEWDIRIELGDEVIYSETIELQVLYAVTHDEPAPPPAVVQAREAALA